MFIFIHLLLVLQKEWLCLNCQTQRALSGQLGDLPPPPSPSKTPAKSQPTPSFSPTRAVSTTPSPPAPTVTASPTKALTRTPSVSQAPADMSEHDSVTADAKHLVDSAAVKQDEEVAVVESTQVVPEPNREQTLDTAYENTRVKSTPPEQTNRAPVPPADIILRDIADAKETDAKQCGIVEQIEPKAQSEKGGRSEPEQQEPVENDSPSNHTNIAEKPESINKYHSAATVFDNKAEISLGSLQVTDAKLKDVNEAKNVIDEKAHQACDHGTEEVSLFENPAKEGSPELTSPANIQSVRNTHAETIPDNNNGSMGDLDDSPVTVTENEIVNIDYGSASTLERSYTPEKLTCPVQEVSSKDEVENEIMPINGSDAKCPFAHTTNHPDNTKGEFVENEYEVEIKTKNMSPSESPFVHSVRVEVENNKIEGMYFDQAEEKQSGLKSKVEQESIAHESTHESQAPPAETPECANPAFPTSNELIKSELKTKHDILDEISHNASLEKMDITSCTFSALASTDENIQNMTEGANVGAPESEPKATEALPEAQVVECLIPKVATEFTAGKENKETLENESEHIRREKAKHQDQASPTEGVQLETFLAGNENISITDNAKIEKLLQNVQVEDTIEPSDHTPKSTLSQIDEVCLISQMTLPKREDMLSENTQPMLEPSKQTAPRTESVDDEQHSGEVEKTDKTEHNDIRSEMPSFSLTEAEKVLNVSMEKTVKSNTDSVKTENECVVKKDDSLSAVGDQDFPESRENSVPEDRRIKQSLDTASRNAPEQSAIQVVLSGPAVDVKDDLQFKRQIKPNGHQSGPLAQKGDSFSRISDEENELVSGEQKVKPGSQPTKEFPNPQSNSHVLCALDLVVKPSLPCPVASKQDTDKSSEEVQCPGTREKNQDGTKPLIKPKDIEKSGQVIV